MASANVQNLRKLLQSIRFLDFSVRHLHVCRQSIGRAAVNKSKYNVAGIAFHEARTVHPASFQPSARAHTDTDNSADRTTENPSADDIDLTLDDVILKGIEDQAAPINLDELKEPVPPPEDEVSFNVDTMILDSIDEEPAPKEPAPEDDPSFNIDTMILDSVGEEEEGEYADEEDYSDDNIRAQILNVAIEYTSQYGWTEKAISEAVIALGLSEASAGMFPRGGADLVLYFMEECNLALSEHLAQESRQRRLNSGTTLEDVFNRGEFLENAIQVRLKMIGPYINTWPQAMATLTSPSAAQAAFEAGAHMIDEIWFHAGDISTDVDWYVKRGALAAVYGATELYMTTDNSPDFANTWAFLKRRMEEAKATHVARESIANAAQDTKSLLSAAVTTAQNIIGANNRFR